MDVNERADAVAEQVARIRSAMLERHGITDQRRIPPAEQSAIDEAARLARINAHWGITSEIPLIGRIIVLARRAMRIGLRWYINPLAEQQTAFNEAVVRALYQIEGEIESLREQTAGTAERSESSRS